MWAGLKSRVSFDLVAIVPRGFLMFEFFQKSRPVTITRTDQLVKRLREEGASSAAGVNVTALRAMQQATVFACVKVRSETFAQLSPVVYERTATGRKRADDHPLARLLRVNPGDGVTPFEFHETLSAELDLYGDHYRYIVWRGKEVEKFIHIPAEEVTVDRDKGTREVRYKVSGMTVPGKEYFTRRDILHVRDLSLNGLTGMSKVGQCRNTIGLQIACEQHGGNVFKNGAAPNATMEFPHALTLEQHKRLQDDLDDNWNGKKSGRTMILESGGKLVPFSMPLKDAQFLETRQFGRTEICGIFRVPPHMVGDLSRSTFSNMEQEAANLVQYSLAPLVRRVESVINSTILADGPFYLEYLIDSLVRGDIKTRMESYARAISSGIMTPDEARAKENMEPDPSGAGAKLYMMANVVPIELAGQAATSPLTVDPSEAEPMAQEEKPATDDTAQGNTEERDDGV